MATVKTATQQLKQNQEYRIRNYDNLRLAEVTEKSGVKEDLVVVYLGILADQRGINHVFAMQWIEEGEPCVRFKQLSNRELVNHWNVEEL